MPLLPSAPQAGGDDAVVSPPVLDRVVDLHNPGVTMLIAIWTAGFALRTWLSRHGLLTQIGDEALLSLLYVVPLMLGGWALLAIADRVFQLGIFRRR